MCIVRESYVYWSKIWAQCKMLTTEKILRPGHATQNNYYISATPYFLILYDCGSNSCPAKGEGRVIFPIINLRVSIEINFPEFDMQFRKVLLWKRPRIGLLRNRLSPRNLWRWLLPGKITITSLWKHNRIMINRFSYLNQRNFRVIMARKTVTRAWWWFYAKNATHAVILARSCLKRFMSEAHQLNGLLCFVKRID